MRAAHRIVWLFFFLLFLGASQGTYAQCDGTANTVTVCKKDLDPTTTNFQLAPLLGPHETGGNWSTNDPATFNALNRVTGTVNLWRVNNFGVHDFTYTVNSGTCTRSAVITVNLGGFPGEDNMDGRANARGDDTMVNLYGFLGSQIDGKIQDFNAAWETVTPGITMFLNDNFFDGQGAGAGEYAFTCTVATLGTCAQRLSNVVLEVHRPPNAGQGATEAFCVDEDLSAFNTFDLRTLLTGADSNGPWSEDDGTNQISVLDDAIIDIQAVQNNFGPGDYGFTYGVPRTRPMCSDDEATVTISILTKKKNVPTPILKGLFIRMQSPCTKSLPRQIEVVT